MAEPPSSMSLRCSIVHCRMWRAWAETQAIACPDATQLAPSPRVSLRHVRFSCRKASPLDARVTESGRHMAMAPTRPGVIPGACRGRDTAGLGMQWRRCGRDRVAVGSGCLIAALLLVSTGDGTQTSQLSFVAGLCALAQSHWAIALHTERRAPNCLVSMMSSLGERRESARSQPEERHFTPGRMPWLGCST